MITIRLIQSTGLSLFKRGYTPVNTSNHYRNKFSPKNGERFIVGIEIYTGGYSGGNDNTEPSYKSSDNVIDTDDLILKLSECGLIDADKMTLKDFLLFKKTIIRETRYEYFRNGNSSNYTMIGVEVEHADAGYTLV